MGSLRIAAYSLLFASIRVRSRTAKRFIVPTIRHLRSLIGSRKSFSRGSASSSAIRSAIIYVCYERNSFGSRSSHNAKRDQVSFSISKVSVFEERFATVRCINKCQGYAKRQCAIAQRYAKERRRLNRRYARVVLKSTRFDTVCTAHD